MSALLEYDRRLFTADDLLRMPDELRVELIKGKLICMPPSPGASHGSIGMDLATEANYFIRRHKLGQGFMAETGFKLESDPDTVIAPDFAFVSKDRLPEVMPAKYLELAPDLVLEVRSPSDRLPKVVEKMNQWIDGGVRLAWELNPATRILTVYRPEQQPQELTVDDTLTGEDVLPGFELAIRSLFTR